MIPRLLKLTLLFFQFISISPCSCAALVTKYSSVSQKRSDFNSGTLCRINRASKHVAKMLPVDVSEMQSDTSISDPDYIDAAPRIRFLDVPVPQTIALSGTATVSYIYWKAKPKSQAFQRSTPTLPILLIPGFDSSVLEFRRIGPKLASEGVDVYAVDLLGFGFTQFENIRDFSAEAKVTTLKQFWKTLHAEDDYATSDYSRNFVVAGASLGGAAAIELAASSVSGGGNNLDNPVKGMVLIDAQGFVDGVGPMASLPTPLAKLGIQVLKSLPLRNSANQMSYFDRESFATDDALKIGRLHCLRPGWENAMLNYMLSGGFSPSKKVSQCEMPTLVLWGRQDGILNGEELAPRFLSELPKAQLRWVEECGHVPHLEQPLVTAQQIAEFLKTDELINKSNQQIFNIPSLTSVKVGAISWIQNITSDVLLPKPMK
jgi:pimeloyl-ACP methyl ester carboxylesterase